MQNPVRWFEIYVQNMPRAKVFYEKVLGITLSELKAPLPDLEMQQFPFDKEAPGCTGALLQMKGVSSGGMGTVVYFGSKDCAIEEKRVAAAGGRIHRSKMSIGPHGFIALAYDTEGNMFGLHSMK